MTRDGLSIVLGAVMAFALLAVGPATRADEWNQASKFTFNQPVEVPGMVLSVGTYWFVVPSYSGAVSGVVQIFNADRTELLKTVQTIPALRSDTTDKGDLTFGEQSQARPVALMSWFYPGFLQGHEFLYSRQEEAEFATNPQASVTVTATRGL